MSNLRPITSLLGLASLASLALAFLALDDITTDNATEFPLEYTILVLCGAWFVWIVWRLAAQQLRIPAVTGGALLALNCVGIVKLAIEGRPAHPATGYLLLRLAFGGLLLFTLWLTAAPLRRLRAG